MKRVNLTILTAAISFSLSHSVMADDLFTVYKLASQYDPQIKAAYADRSAAREAKPQARSELVPTVTGQLSVTASDRSQETLANSNGVGTPNPAADRDRKNDDQFENWGYRLDLTQSIYHRDEWIGLKVADADIGQADANYASAEQALAVRVTERYFNVLSAWENLKFTQVETKATGSQLDQTQKRFDVGLISITDVNEAQSRYDLAVAEEIRAENDTSNAKEQLREITDKYHTTYSTLDKNFHLITPIPANINEWSDYALRRNPDLRAAQYAVESAHQQVKFEHSFHYPTVDLVGNITYDRSNQESAFKPEVDQHSISIQANIPIFRGGFVSANTREAAHRHESAKEGFTQQRRLIISQTRQAFLTVMASISRTKALDQAVKSSKSALDATNSGFEVGTRTIVEVLNAQTEYHRAIRDAAQERYTYIVNTVRLKQAAGLLAKADIQQINAWLNRKVHVSTN